MKKFDYDAVVGHSLIQKKLRQAVDTDHVVSAYLFCGNPGIGKKTVAYVFAAALLCQSPRNGGACHECASCRLVESGNHPDLITLQMPSDKKTFGIDPVREQIIQEAYIRPFHAGRKIFVIENSELLTVDAQNALLKILEEPPLYAVFLLLAPTKEQLLQTVLSRCLKMQFLPLESSECHNYFSRLEADPGRKELAASLSQGIIGKGLALLENEDYYQLYQTTITLLSAFPNDAAALSRMQSFFVQNREQISNVIDFMLIFLRDCMRLKIADNTKPICTDRPADVKRFANEYSPASLIRMMEAVVAFRTRLLRNASFTAAGLELLIKLQEETHG